nr:hypothetical protein [uncultured Albidiferax sp.]
MHASQSPRHSRSTAAKPLSTRPRASRLLRWGQVLAGGLAVCLALSGCGGGDNNGSDGKARDVRCAR